MTEVAVVETTDTQTAADTTTAEAVENFDTWISKQPETVRNSFDTHVDGLKSALKSERDERKTLEKQLRDLSKSAETGSEFKVQVDKLANDLQESDNKATFYSEAHDAGVKNLKLAWVAAREFGAIDRYGKVDISKLRINAPEVFTTPRLATPPANAGNGANQDGVTKPDMNSFMRGAR